MSLTCACADFDKGDHDAWWEAPYRTNAPLGARCCECGAPIDFGDQVQAFDSMEVYEPDVPAPRPPWDVTSANEMSDEEFAALDAAWDEFCDQYGWDSDYERFERCVSTDYRCERCGDLAEAFEDDGLGFCQIAPGGLIEAHTEYVNDYAESKRPIIWSKDRTGVFNPRQRTWRDDIRTEARRLWLRSTFFVTYGWRIWLNWSIAYPVERIAMTWFGYRWVCDDATITGRRWVPK